MSLRTTLRIPFPLIFRMRLRILKYQIASPARITETIQSTAQQLVIKLAITGAQLGDGTARCDLKIVSKYSGPRSGCGPLASFSQGVLPFFDPAFM